ncbi:hypothetical protein VNO77_02629 [Canavalia gladiata]|uniref:Uncharacterized protein n=1 Tax=Canavalia gladiata TaxID=3824 RepID=A0AAN9R6A1_CANGL
MACGLMAWWFGSIGSRLGDNLLVKKGKLVFRGFELAPLGMVALSSTNLSKCKATCLTPHYPFHSAITLFRLALFTPMREDTTLTLLHCPHHRLLVSYPEDLSISRSWILLRGILTGMHLHGYHCDVPNIYSVFLLEGAHESSKISQERDLLLNVMARECRLSIIDRISTSFVPCSVPKNKSNSQRLNLIWFAKVVQLKRTRGNLCGWIKKELDEPLRGRELLDTFQAPNSERMHRIEAFPYSLHLQRKTTQTYKRSRPGGDFSDRSKVKARSTLFFFFLAKQRDRRQSRERELSSIASGASNVIKNRFFCDQRRTNFSM